MKNLNLKNNYTLAPIILFAYDRPHYLIETLRALQKNDEAILSYLIIYCDGPKPGCTHEGLNNIRKVKELARSKQWCGEVEIIESDKNIGLATSVIQGVTETLNKFGKVIVLEDDLVVSNFFLKYMNEALYAYQDEEKVASISGHNFPINLKNAFPNSQTFFVRFATTWGWATWKRSWDLYNNDATFLMNEIKLKKLKKDFSFNYSYPYFSMLKKAETGIISSWGIRWYTSLYLQQKLTLFPLFSLVKNIGKEGTNIKVDNSIFMGIDLYNKPIKLFEDKIEENLLFRNLFISHFKKHNRKKLSFKNLKYYFFRSLFFIKQFETKFTSHNKSTKSKTSNS